MLLLHAAVMVVIAGLLAQGPAAVAAAASYLSSSSPVPLPPLLAGTVDMLEAWARANHTEAALAALVLVTLVNLALGSSANRRRVLQISDALFAPDEDVVRPELEEDAQKELLQQQAGGDAPSSTSSSLTFLARHFAGHGHARSTNPALWWQESLNHSVLWASGRRNLDGALVAVETRPRQDLLHRLGLAQMFGAVFLGSTALEPREGDMLLPGSSGEGLFFDGFVEADAMPWRGCLVVGTRACLRALAKKFPVDIGTLAQAHAIDPATTEKAASSSSSGGDPRRLPYAWPSADLGVLTDQPLLFQALLGAPRVAGILSDPNQAQLVRKHLRYLHVTSDFPGRNARRVAAEIKLPAAAAQLRDAEPALELVMAVVDSLQAFRQTPEARKRADDARQAANEARAGARRAAEEERRVRTAHEETLARQQKLRQERLELEREKAKREGRLDEWEKAQRQKAERKAMKKRAVRI
jgi:hypothetical protein